jgi:hypothetical protein
MVLTRDCNICFETFSWHFTFLDILAGMFGTIGKTGRLQAHDAMITCLDASDQNMILSAGMDTRILRWDFRTLNQVPTFVDITVVLECHCILCQTVLVLHLRVFITRTTSPKMHWTSSCREVGLDLYRRFSSMTVRCSKWPLVAPPALQQWAHSEVSI